MENRFWAQNNNNNKKISHTNVSSYVGFLHDLTVYFPNLL